MGERRCIFHLIRKFAFLFPVFGNFCRRNWIVRFQLKLLPLAKPGAWLVLDGCGAAEGNSSLLGRHGLIHLSKRSKKRAFLMDGRHTDIIQSRTTNQIPPKSIPKSRLLVIPSITRRHDARLVVALLSWLLLLPVPRYSPALPAAPLYCVF